LQPSGDAAGQDGIGFEHPEQGAGLHDFAPANLDARRGLAAAPARVKCPWRRRWAIESRHTSASPEGSTKTAHTSSRRSSIETSTETGGAVLLAHLIATSRPCHCPSLRDWLGTI